MSNKSIGYALALGWSTIAAITLLLIAPSAAIAASTGGSDSPTPYSVTTEGITLPEGIVFTDNGHINARTSSGKTANVHFESKCIYRDDAECAGKIHETAQYIGKSFMPWSALGIDIQVECIAWVQLSDFNEHFGEGGQTPVGGPCGTDPEEPTNPVDPEEPVTPTDPEEPTNPVDPEEPVTPTDPEEPTNPVDPEEPVTPTATGLANTGSSISLPLSALSAGALMAAGGILTTAKNRRKRGAVDN